MTRYISRGFSEAMIIFPFVSRTHADADSADEEHDHASDHIAPVALKEAFYVAATVP